MNEIITELLKLINLLQDSKPTERVSQIEIDNAIKGLNDAIALLQFDDSEVINSVDYMLAPKSEVTKIAALNGWTQQLEQIVKKIQLHKGYIRIAEKSDPSRFGNVKDGRFTNANSFAGEPGRLMISKKNWQKILSAYQLSFWQKIAVNINRKKVQECLCYGDTQPAVVVSVSPFVVAAYSDEMDAVVLLLFPEALAKQHDVKLYDKMVSVNTYLRHNMIAHVHDIFVGKDFSRQYSDFRPLIGDLLSSDSEMIKLHKSHVPQYMWDYVKSLGEDYLRKHSNLIRKGFWFIDKKVY